MTDAAGHPGESKEEKSQAFVKEKGGHDALSKAVLFLSRRVPAWYLAK